MQPQKPIASIVILILLAVTGCSSEPQSVATPPSPTAKTKTLAVKTPSPKSDPIEAAADKAASANNLTRAAQSKQDWDLVTSRWNEAIALLRTLPNSHPKKALVQQKIAEYQRQLTATKQQIAKAAKPNKTATKVSAKVALAQHLKQTKAKMYATYWCSVCRWQREQFGQEAAAIIKSIEIECDPRGQNAQPKLCSKAKVSGYPSWEINGEIIRGGIPLEDLAEISGYRGSLNFN